MDKNEPPREQTAASPVTEKTAVKGKRAANKKEQIKKRSQKRWIITAFALSFCITAVLSFGSNEVVNSLSVFVAIPVLLFFIIIGIIFDMVGLSVAIADIRPFNSMAARRLKTGKKAVWLIKNAEKVSSFCGDLIGDISGVMSGATGAAIAAELFKGKGSVLLSLFMTSLIAASMVGCKAIGKLLAVKYSDKIVMYTAKIMSGFKK